MMAETKPKAPLPDLVQVDVKPSCYQPNKAEIEETIDMPGWSLDKVRDTFMRRFVAKNS